MDWYDCGRHGVGWDGLSNSFDEDGSNSLVKKFQLPTFETGGNFVGDAIESLFPRSELETKVFGFVIAFYKSKDIEDAKLGLREGISFGMDHRFVVVRQLTCPA